ncbi:MAG TPA: hypothetical protein DIW64_17055 [Cellvibrio sp.]|nr:hypothetical protein [Cellvibrio sp.]
MGKEKTYLISNIKDKEFYYNKVNLEIESIKYALKTFDGFADVNLFFHKFEIEDDFLHRMHMVKNLIVDSRVIPPVGLINLLEFHARLVIGVIDGVSRISASNKDYAHVSLYMVYFIRIAIEKGVDYFLADFNVYLDRAATRDVHYLEARTILDVYKIFKNNLTEIEVSEAVEEKILNVINRLPTGNNRAHIGADFLEDISSERVGKAAVSYALAASELIEDDSTIVSFLTSLAGATGNPDFRDSVLDESFEISRRMSFIHDKLSSLISILKIRSSSSRDVYIEEIKNVLRSNHDYEVKIQYYWQLCELIDDDLNQEAYADMLGAVRNSIMNFDRSSWVGISCIIKYLKSSDISKLLQDIFKMDFGVEGKLRILKNVDSEISRKYLTAISKEIESKEDGLQKIYLFATFGEVTNNFEFHLHVLRMVEDLGCSKDKIQAFLYVDRNFSGVDSGRIFCDAVKVLSHVEDDVEYRRCFLSVLSLKGITDDFMSKVIDDYLHSEEIEFKRKVFENLSHSIVRSGSKNNLLIRKLNDVISKTLDGEAQTRILSSVFKNLDRSSKIDSFPMLLHRYSKTSRADAFGFIGGNIDFLYELGGESLLVSLRNSCNDALKWWP